MADGYRLVSGNKLTEAQATFRSVLETLLLVVLSSDDEAKLVRFSPPLMCLGSNDHVLVARNGHICPRVPIGCVY